MMNKKIDLPAIIKLEDFDGDAILYINHLYSIFEKDFIISQPILFEKKVTIGNQKIVDGKELVFWHITSKGGKNHINRLPDLRRCERLHWIRFSIEHIHEIDGLLFWEQPSNRAGNFIIYLEKYDFVIILRKLNYVFILITAYHVDYKNKRQKLLKDYQKYKAKLAPKQ